MYIEDLDTDDVILIQDEERVTEFNKKYDESFEYYFIKPINPFTAQIYGSFRIYLDSAVYPVGNILRELVGV